MPNATTKLTDQSIKLFYAHFVTHYSNCKRRVSNVHEVWNEMHGALQYATESPSGSFYYLDRVEKDKLYTAFDVLFRALPEYRNLPYQQQNTIRMSKVKISNPTQVTYCTHYNYSDSLTFDWLLLNSFTNRSYRYSYHHAYTGHCWSTNKHKHDKSSKDDFVKLLALLILFVKAIFLAILTAIALYYLLNEIANNMERFWFNEGWLKGALSMASAVAFGAGSTLFSLTFASVPLIALALGAGLNPFTVIITATVMLGIIGASIGSLAMSALYDVFNKRTHQQAIDPQDPQRFRVTQAEEQTLIAKGIDPIKVKCAMVALRAEMANLLGSEKPIPSFFQRQFGDGAKIQELLNKVRLLRNGDLYRVDVGELLFDCSITQAYYPLPSFSFYQQVSAAYPATTYPDPIPSAPPPPYDTIVF